MYESEEYKIVQAAMETSGFGKSFKCGDWPPPGEVCATCGAKS